MNTLRFIDNLLFGIIIQGINSFANPFYDIQKMRHRDRSIGLRVWHLLIEPGVYPMANLSNHKP
ncbi:MAG: hypothetical protein PUP90_12450 [Nostoc sp. S4]|nr:hypothetical protein [Nostoc sp. S4]